MTNAEIAAVLNEIAARLRQKKESIFKIRAYEKAAKEIDELQADVGQLASDGRLREIPGVGEAISNKIGELVSTGRLEYLERLKRESLTEEAQS